MHVGFTWHVNKPVITLLGQRYAIILAPQCPTVQAFSLYGRTFRVAGPSENGAPNDRKIALNSKVSKGKHNIYSTGSPSPKFQFRSTIHHFKVLLFFATNAL